MDAATQVDARYRFAPTFRISRLVPAAAPRSSQRVVEKPSVIAAPPAGSVWGQEIGRDERAFFDPTNNAEPPRVRVHRTPREEPPLSPRVDTPPDQGDVENRDDPSPDMGE